MPVIAIDEEDIPAARALRVEFAKFWSGEAGEPREVYDRFIAATPVTADATVETAGGACPGVWVHPADARTSTAMLFLHGGGYGLGSASAYVGLVSQLASRARISAFVLDYPLAPEATLPDALHMAGRALAHVGARYGAVVVAGDSAGGGLSLATVMQARTDRVPVAACVVFSPWTDLSLSSPSVTENAVGDPLLDPAYLRASAAAYAGACDVRDPRASPLFADMNGLPPMLLQVGSDEILLDDSRRFAEAVAGAGGQVTLEVWQGMHHVFQLNVAQLKSARRALDRAAAFIAGSNGSESGSGAEILGEM